MQGIRLVRGPHGADIEVRPRQNQDSAAGGTSSGSGTAGRGNACQSGPSSPAWKDPIIMKIVSAACQAVTSLVENERPSRLRATLNRIGRSARPGRRK